MVKRLPEICRIQYGFAFDSNKFSAKGGIPLVRIRDVVRGFSETYTTEVCSKDFAVNNGDILVGMDGEFNIARWKGGKAWLNQRVCKLAPSEQIDDTYLFYFMPKALKAIEAKTSFVTVKHLSAKELNKIEIPVPPLNEQRQIAKALDKVNMIISYRKQQLAALDTLIKARFVEMFGEPLEGSAKWPIHQVGNIANSVDPQPSHRTPPIDEDGIPYVSIKDCDYVTGKIDFAGARKVSRNVLAEHLERYTLHDGDFIIGKIGTIGNPIFVPARDDYTLSANIVLIQPNTHLVSPYFLKYSFMSPFVERQFDEARNATSQAAFGIQKVRTVKIMNPPMNVQAQFEAFAKQTDKSKVVVQQALDEAQVLFDSLMQEYFN